MTISVVVPAYNEEKYISNVIGILQKIDLIGEIIVVNDGSTDDTAEAAKKYSIKLIEHTINKGKGAAMHTGFQASSLEVVMFLDADLIGLSPTHILSLSSPVIESMADMTLGIFDNGRLRTDLAQVVAPSLTGQRCIRKSCFVDFNHWTEVGYGIESALNKFAQKKSLRVTTVALEGVTHVMKEEKYGLVHGFSSRMKMYREIVKNGRSEV